MLLYSYIFLQHLLIIHFFFITFLISFFFSLFYLFFLEFYEFRPNSIPKASSRGECCPSLIYSNLVLFLVDVKLGFFPIRMNLIINLLLIFSFFFVLSFQLGFMLLNSFWKFDFPPFMVLVIAILNDGNISYFIVS